MSEHAVVLLAMTIFLFESMPRFKNMDRNDNDSGDANHGRRLPLLQVRWAIDIT